LLGAGEGCPAVDPVSRAPDESASAVSGTVAAVESPVELSSVAAAAASGSGDRPLYSRRARSRSTWMLSRKISKLWGIAGPESVDEPAEEAVDDVGEPAAGAAGEVLGGRTVGSAGGVDARGRPGPASADDSVWVGRAPNWPCMYSRRTVSMSCRSSFALGAAASGRPLPGGAPAPAVAADSAEAEPCRSALRISASLLCASGLSVGGDMPASEEAAVEPIGSLGEGTGGRTRGDRISEDAVAVVATLSRPPRSAACSSDVDAAGAVGGAADEASVDAVAADDERVSLLGKGRRGRPVVVEAAVPGAGELVLESVGGGVGGRDVVTSP
jgi:hypothetical protein